MENDETILNADNAPKQPEQQPTPDQSQPVSQQPTQEQHEDKEKTSKRKKRIGMTVAEGIAAAGLVVGRIAPVQLFPSKSDIDGGLLSDDDLLAEADAEVEPDAETASDFDHSSLEGHDLEVATGVDDSMSFAEAFQAAREETGPGGLFVWHGHSYGTYYSNEWESMSDEDKEQYYADVVHTSDSISEEQEDFDDTDMADVGVEPIEMIDDLEPVSIDGIETDADVADIIVPDDLEVEVATDLADADLADVEIEPVEMIDDLEPISVDGIETDAEVADIIVPDDLDAEVDVDLVDADVDLADAEIEPVEMIDGLESIAPGELEVGEDLADIIVPDDLNVPDDFNIAEPHLDIDPSGMLAIDPDIPMDNDMDMDEFV